MLQAVPEYYFAGYSHPSAATASGASPAVDTTEVLVVLRKYNSTGEDDTGVLYLLPSYPRNTSLPTREVPNVKLPLPLPTPKPPQVQSNTVDVNEDIEIHYVSSSQASDWDWSDNEEEAEEEEGNDIEKTKSEDYPTHGTLLELRDEQESAVDSNALPARSKDNAHFLIRATTSSTPESDGAGTDVPVLHPHTRLTVLGYEQTGQHAVYVLVTFPKSSTTSSVSSSNIGVMIYRCVDPAVLSCMCDRVETNTLRRLPVHVPSATTSNNNSEDRTQMNGKGETEVVYSPPLDTSLLLTNYGIDTAGASLRYRLSGAQHTKRLVHFVGVACGIPWVCEVDSNVSDNNNTDVATPQYCEPLPLCYDEASLMRLYAPQALTTNTTNTNTLLVNEYPSTINNERPALPITMVGVHRVKIAGPYGVPLQCDTRMLDRFALHHGDRLRALTVNTNSGSTKEGTGRLATVIGICGGCLVVLYDGDTRATLLPSEVNSEAALRQHFVPLTERIANVKAEEKKVEEADDETKKDERDEEEEEHAMTTDTSTPFINFLTAYGLHMSRHTQSNAPVPNSSMSKDAWRVAQAYFMTDTVQRMSAALRVYHKVQVEMEVEGCEQQQEKPLLSWEDYGRLVAKYVDVV